MTGVLSAKTNCDLQLVQTVLKPVLACKRSKRERVMNDDERRSGCPINLSLEVLGDKWSRSSSAT
jgi:hypothetical protein